MKQTFTHCLTGGLLFLFFLPLFGQTPMNIALRHVQERHAAWGLEPSDINDLVITDQAISRHNGITHLYLQQRYQGIPIFNAVAAIHLSRGGEVVYATQRLVRDLDRQKAAIQPKLTPEQAAAAAARHLDRASVAGKPQKMQTLSDRHYRLEVPGLSDETIPVKLAYFADRQTGALYLAWQLEIAVAGTADAWNMLIDAQTGAELHRNNHTVYCHFEAHANDIHHSVECLEELRLANHLPKPPGFAGAQYNVFPIPLESPAYGNRQLMTDPQNTEASPFGWHDTNGAAGAEYTITRGNNAHAYADPEDEDLSAGDEPDGGTQLKFDYYFNANAEPDTLQNAAVTQLFYMTNIMHDITYHYGFDEAAGNFQQRNYTGVDGGSDAVRAEAQDGSGLNNANFSTRADGSPPRMQMFLWSNNSANNLQVTGPAEVVGSYPIGLASFGPTLAQRPLTGQLAAAFDASSAADLVCMQVANGNEITGKVALITRGECNFQDKVLNAQAAGAIGVIICNPENTIIAMGEGGNTDPTIPAVLMRESDCARLRPLLGQGVMVRTQQGAGPQQRDGSFDNGIIAHEYAHGISNRLIGGSSNTNCLNNNEQMGEGWSDFFTLALTARAQDLPNTTRGIGRYALGQDLSGDGIRRQPYTNDFRINDLTYDNIITTGASAHALGETWASALWDMYWALVDRYGFDEDIYHGAGGNNIAIRLVMDGMKLITCEPGFVDGRDALLVADSLNNDGANTCLIWEVFARRGLGINAHQGSSYQRNDNREDFSILPECVKTLKISKSSNVQTINAGEKITYTLRVDNHKDEVATAVTVLDELPEGLILDAGSVNGATTVPQDGGIRFDIGDLEPGASVTIRYTVTTTPSLYSLRLSFNGAETGDPAWRAESLRGAEGWKVIDTLAFGGRRAWYVPNRSSQNDHLLRPLPEQVIQGRRPALRFHHRYNTEPGYDGGFVELSRNGGSWQPAGDRFLRNSYRGKLSRETFNTDNLLAFWGDSEAYIDSYLDLSDLSGQSIDLRWRFGSDQGTGGEGWFVDDVELLDLFSYEGEACVSSGEGDVACAVAPEGGVIVESQFLTSTDDPRAPLQFLVFPNPAGDVLNLNVEAPRAGAGTVSLFTVDGRQVLHRALSLSPGAQTLSVPVGDLPRGFYLLQLRSESGEVTRKVVLE